MKDIISKAGTLIEALPYLQKFRGKVFVFKYGGHAMVDETLRQSFVRDVVLLKHVGIHPVVVHGGGPQIKETLDQLGVQSQFVNGLRVTDKETMKIVEMVLVGRVNSEIVNLFNKMGGAAVGLSGVDGNLLQAVKMPKQKIKNQDGSTQECDLGFVGEIKNVNPKLVNKLVYEENFIPVISPIGISEEGDSLNINADTAAAEIAKALHAEKLILITDVDGVKGKDGKVMSVLRKKQVKDMIEEGVISGGMIPKISSGLEALHHGVESVAIVNGQIQHAILLEIFTDEGVGTMVY
ncbi:MAG: acetylglutamate kinase [Deltaproteobacteria bacterium]|nr:acetylglutamate kinase [Deltaproteobacteria bacterium]